MTSPRRPGHISACRRLRKRHRFQLVPFEGDHEAVVLVEDQLPGGGPQFGREPTVVGAGVAAPLGMAGDDTADFPFDLAGEGFRQPVGGDAGLGKMGGRSFLDILASSLVIAPSATTMIEYLRPFLAFFLMRDATLLTL